MAIRIRFKSQVVISSDSNEFRDLGNATYEILADGLGEGGVWKTLLPKNSTNTQLNFPNLADVKFIYIRTNAKDSTLSPVEVLIRRNLNTNEEIAITPLSSTKEGFLAMTTTGLTALFGTNASSTTDMEITIFAGAD